MALLAEPEVEGRGTTRTKSVFVIPCNVIKAKRNKRTLKVVISWEQVYGDALTDVAIPATAALKRDRATKANPK